MLVMLSIVGYILKIYEKCEFTLLTQKWEFFSYKIVDINKNNANIIKLKASPLVKKNYEKLCSKLK